MARPKSDDKRKALLEAATRVVSDQGLSAPTLSIAKEAGVANGSLFTYFETKSVLFNQLYLELKAEMASAALKGLPGNGGMREQLQRSWSNWMHWAVENPDKRRVLAQLDVSGDISDVTRAAGQRIMAPIAVLMERVRASGTLRDAPFSFVMGLANALAETTMDFIVRNPTHANRHSKLGFEALWRMLR